MSFPRFAVCVLAALLTACSAPVRQDSRRTATATTEQMPQPAAVAAPSVPASPAATPAAIPADALVAQPTAAASTAQAPDPAPAPPISSVQPEIIAPSVPQPAAADVPAPAPVKPAASASPALAAAPKPVAASAPATASNAPAVVPKAASAPVAPVVSTSILRGQITLQARSGQTLGVDEVRDAVLWFTPNRTLAAPKPGRYTIDTRNKRFSPRTLVLPVGSSVDFPNSDPVIHNVFSLSPGNEFDLGLYGEGESAEAVLAKPGVVMAFCNVHYSMFAALVVVDTPYTAQVGADGRFELRDLPAGGGTLHLWHPRAERWTQSLVLPSPAPMNVSLPIVKTLIPQHTNKTGGSYRPGR